MSALPIAAGLPAAANRGPGRSAGAPATFDELLGLARAALEVHLAGVPELGEPEVRASIDSHRMLTGALLRLARVILCPPVDIVSREVARGTTPNRQLEPVLCRLAVLAGDPAPEPPSLSSDAALARASHCLGAAADLLATHRDGAGLERSPESCRLRHPAFLGFALREWNQLLKVSAELAGALSRRAAELGVSPGACQPVMGYPAPLARTGVAAGPRLAVTVARPAGARSGALGELADRLAAVRLRAWELCTRGEISVAAMENLAAVGSRLNCLLWHLTSVRADQRPAGPEQRRLTAAAAEAAHRARAWVRVREAIVPLRNWPSTGPSLAAERKAVGRLLAVIARDRRPASRQLVAALQQLADAYGGLPDWQLRTLRMPRFVASLIACDQVGLPLPRVGVSLSRAAASALRRTEEAYRTLASEGVERPGG